MSILFIYLFCHFAVGEFCEWANKLSECGTRPDTLVLLSTLLEYTLLLPLSPALSPPLFAPSYPEIEKLKVKVNEVSLSVGAVGGIQGVSSFSFFPAEKGGKTHKRSYSEM